MTPFKFIALEVDEIAGNYSLATDHGNLLVVRQLASGLHRVLHSTALHAAAVGDALQFINMHGITHDQLSVLKAHHGDAKELQNQLVDQHVRDDVPQNMQLEHSFQTMHNNNNETIHPDISDISVSL
jgi:hypothetical protein